MPRHINYFAKSCQCFLLAALFFPPAVLGAAEAGPDAAANSFIKGLSRLKFDGSTSLNWRNVGPRKPGFETQIQDEVYLADMYFGVSGPVFDGLPFAVEWHMPTAGQGQPELNQLYFEYDRLRDFRFQFGKFLVPFGRYNELYTSSQFLTVTRPLLYASPDTLDLVVRLNSPRPPLSFGYTDIGARVSYYPPNSHLLLPSELTFFVVNGLGETSNRQRTFPDPQNLGITPPPPNGVEVDFSHRNNNLADNNNYKSFGGRLVYGLGDVRLPWPLPEGLGDLQGMSLGLSAMAGQYDLEANLKYQMLGIDASFDYHGLNFSGEYMYGFSQSLVPILDTATALKAPLSHAREFEINRGYFIQASYPLWRKPRWGKRVTGVLVFNQIFRRGPREELLLNLVDNNTFTVFPSVKAEFYSPLRITTEMTKYTAAIDYQLTDHFALKSEYSYWVMGKATTRTANSIGLVDIYQSVFTVVLSF